MGLASGGALHEVSVVIATMNLVVAVTEEAHMVRAAEGALAPSRVDGPHATTIAASTVTTAASTPTAGARMHRASALRKAEGVLAAPDARVPVAESANMVRLAERPPPSVEGCCLQACLIVPICLCWQRVCILVWTGLLREGTHLIIASSLVGEDIRRRIFDRG